MRKEGKMDIAYLAMVAVIFLLLLGQVVKKKDNADKKEAPVPVGRWPVLGHIPMLAGSIPAHQVLSALADRYGPAITLHLGRQRALLIRNRELAKECFTSNDRNLAGRPRTTAGRHLGLNFACFALDTNSRQWRDTRKIVVHQLLSRQHLQSVQHLWISEVEMCVRGLYGLWRENKCRSVAVEMKERFWRFSVNMITNMAAGKRLSGEEGDDKEAQEFRRVTGQLLHLLTVPNIGDFLPFLGWLDLQGYERASKKTAREMDSIMQRWMEEHCLKMKMDSEVGHVGNPYFFHLLLSMQKDGKLPDHYEPGTFVKATLLILIIAGAETTSMELTWAFSLLMNNRRVLKKAQAELDMQVGRERVVHQSDIRKLPYLRAIVKETLRLYPVGPLLVPHEATEDCTVGGYHVRAGTHLLVNVWKIHRDPSVWSDPLRFHPERFLEQQHADIDVWGQDFELIPFGSGRRSCVGSSLAVQVMQLTLARLLHGFDWDTPSGGPVDMSEGFAFSLFKLEPLQLLISPRLPLTV